MSQADGRFECTFTKAELKEVMAISRRYLQQFGHPRLFRAAMVLLLLPLAVVFGFVMAPFELGRLSFDSEMSVAAIAFFAAIAGVAAERIAFLLSLRLMLRAYRQRAASSRVLSVGAAGVNEAVGGFRFGMDWAAAHIVRGRATLVFLSPGGEWLGLPLRLLPAGSEALERDITLWRSPR